MCKLCVCLRCFSKKMKTTTSFKITTCQRHQRHLDSAPITSTFISNASNFKLSATIDISVFWLCINGITMFPRAYRINHDARESAPILASLMIKKLHCASLSVCAAIAFAQDLFYLK